jgi:hypothetical protein
MVKKIIIKWSIVVCLFCIVIIYWKNNNKQTAYNLQRFDIYEWEYYKSDTTVIFSKDSAMKAITNYYKLTAGK